MSKTDNMPPSTVVEKIKAKFNIDDDEFIKTLNIIDHWITLPNPQKSL